MHRLLRVACLAWGVSTVAFAADWTTLDDATLLPNAANDGDSFHVRHGSKEYIFRLYFVDCPEREDNFPDRVDEQAAYWGVDRELILRTGQLAAQFTRETLSGEPLRIETCWEDARGSSEMTRYFALVEVDGRDLAWLLAEEGLARVYGKQIDPPGGPSGQTIVQRLDAAARQAKSSRRGIWSRSQPAGVADEQPAFFGIPVGEQVNGAPAEETPREERSLTTTQRVTAYTLQQPYRPLGTFEVGTTLAVVATLDREMVHVRYTAPGGKVTHAACKSWELGIAAPAVR